ncbi:MAG: hypothetical protein WBH03_14965 [Cyclobacteriaceae bacterium]
MSTATKGQANSEQTSGLNHNDNLFLDISRSGSDFSLVSEAPGQSYAYKPG